ncbi:hypothetical protein KR026_011082 [Drosophila bipectinata]|nr:hypothetical protein KR026_011082 [Drosophila bipectinata]
MSDTIEFVLPSRGEYSDEDDGGVVSGSRVVGVGGVGVVDSDDATTYVVLDGLGNEYDEEFLIISEDGVDGDLLVDEMQLQQFESCQELLVAGSPRMPVPGDQHFQYHPDDLDEQFVVTEMSEVDELVEVDQDDFGLEYSSQLPEEYEDEEEEEEFPSPSLSPPPVKPPATKPQPALQISRRSFTGHDEEEELKHEVKPSDKMLEEFKGPRRYLLFDDLVATIVDFDDENTPIVEFSMISSILDEKLPVECGICPDVMHKSKLSKHQKTHLVAGTNRYACMYCSETYRDCKYLAGHARRHMGIRPYVCEVCKLYFSTKQDLRVHNQRRHLEKEHICEMCGKTFAQNTQLKRHRETTHEKKRRYQCQYCHKAYYKNFSLQEHIRNVHMGMRRMLKCPFCGMQCRDAHKMARHRKEMHLSQGSYVCHLCHEEFTDINYFDAHKRSIQCRSNTRRLVGDEDPDIDAPGLLPGSVTGDMPGEAAPLGLLDDEELVEDAGLLVDDGQPQEEVQHYLSTVEGEPHYVQISDYDDQRLLVENVVIKEDIDDEVGEELLTEEQYIQAVQQQQLQLQQNPNQSHHFNDELIYEITLKTEDN